MKKVQVDVIGLTSWMPTASISHHGGIGNLALLKECLERVEPIGELDYSLLVFAGDNGVSREGISSYRPLSSKEIVKRHLNGTALPRILMDRLEKPEVLIDVGLFDDIDNGGLLDKKVARGTANLRNGPALNQYQVDRALEVGEQMALGLADQGQKAMGLAEIGVGNTIGAYVILGLMLDVHPHLVVGFGSDASGELYRHRLNLVREVTSRLAGEPKDIRLMIQQVGSLEMTAMAAAVLGATRAGILVALDGLVAAVAALMACGFDSRCKRLLIASSRTCEPGQVIALKELGLIPVLDLGINYGEGLGAGFGLFLLEMAYRFSFQQDFGLQGENSVK